MSDRTARAREVQAAIGRILLEDWDPIGVRHVTEAQDEYDHYVGSVYRLVATGAGPRAIAEHLCAIEQEQMGLRGGTPENRRQVAEKLSRLDVRLEQH